MYMNVFVSKRSTIKSGFDNDLDVMSVLLSRLYSKWRLSFFYCCSKRSMLISSARKFPKKKPNLNTPLYPRWNVIVNRNDPNPQLTQTTENQTQNWTFLSTAGQKQYSPNNIILYIFISYSVLSSKFQNVTFKGGRVN